MTKHINQTLYFYLNFFTVKSHSYTAHTLGKNVLTIISAAVDQRYSNN